MGVWDITIMIYFLFISNPVYLPWSFSIDNASIKGDKYVSMLGFSAWQYRQQGRIYFLENLNKI